MLYKLTLGLLATAVIGEELAAPVRRLGYWGRNIYTARGKTDSGTEGETINLDELSKRELIRLNKNAVKKLMKVKRNMKKVKEECDRRRQLLLPHPMPYPIAAPVAPGIVYPVAGPGGLIVPTAAKGEADSKKEGKKIKYRKMSKEELIELVTESAMDVQKAKKRLKKLKRKCD